MADTILATVEVLALSPVRARGRLVALAIVELVLDGVPIVLQGVRVVRRADGLAVVEMPCCRHADGDLIPAVVLPVEVEDAIARQVLLELAPHGVVVPA